MGNKQTKPKSHIEQLRDQFKSQVDSMFNGISSDVLNIGDAFDPLYHYNTMEKLLGPKEKSDTEVYDNELGIFGTASFPPMDVIDVHDTETGEIFSEVQIVVAPMRKEDIKVSVKNNGGPLGNTFPNYKTLVVRAESNYKVSTDQRKIAGMKRSAWTSETVFDTDKYDLDRISAKVEDGILTIRIPKIIEENNRKNAEPIETPIVVE